MATPSKMKLFSGPASAFARKTRVVVHELGLAERIDVQMVSPQRDVAALSALNPLGKIPVLETDAGALYDSSVICEYLIVTFGDDRMLPKSGPARWVVLSRAALGDGIVEAGMLARLERLRDPSDPATTAWQMEKMRRGLDAVEASASGFPSEPDLGCIAIGCAIGWLHFRLPDLDLLGARPQTRRWYESLAARPSFLATAPQG